MFLLFYPFFFLYFLQWSNPQNLSASKGKLIELPQFSKPIIASSYKLRPGFIAMVQDQAFSCLDYENPYHHLWEFEQLCAYLTILGMSQETLHWKLFFFSYRESETMV
jgi:hypothetical protein